MILVIAVGGLILLGMYCAAKVRGLAQLLMSIFCSVPAGVVLGFTGTTAFCSTSSDPWCDLIIIVFLPFAVIVTLLSLAFLPTNIFKPISGFIIGATISGAILFYTGFISSIFDPAILGLVSVTLILSGGIAGVAITSAKKTPSWQKDKKRVS